MTAVYLAGPYAARARLNELADDLRTMLVDVTASWLDETHDICPGTINAATDLRDADVSTHASNDLDDICNADLLILITAAASGLDPTTVYSGGRHVETGFALAIPIPVLVVGEPENVFHRLGRDQGVYLAPDWPTAVGRVAAHEAGTPWTEALR